MASLESLRALRSGSLGTEALGAARRAHRRPSRCALRYSHSGRPVALIGDLRAARSGIRTRGGPSRSCPRGGAKLLLEPLRQSYHLLAVRFDDDIRNFAIDGIAERIKFVEPRLRVRRLQQRTVFAATRPFPQRVRRCMQIQHSAVLLECGSVGRQQDGAAPRSEDYIRVSNAFA